MLLDLFLALLLGADEEHAAATFCGLLEKGVGLVDEDRRLLQVDDVDAAALAEDELLHLGVPTARLVAEVDAAGEQVLHADRVLGCRQDCLLLKRLLGGTCRHSVAGRRSVESGGRAKRLPPDTATDRGVRRVGVDTTCLLYTSDAADDLTRVDLGGRRIIKK